ncbi:MFS transporter [Saccharopolyspora sp. HNM0986]|uniref:MFS transporter n=1 Tax=Saccharopolyspora galaxeae TaxID=2781241 RepID=UPI00190C5107|nr:MFS transporter [Saccharopolyspora sp. HNM0986]MBK0870198.1 MFS transporter [Saccharopolyspora sp. HNM0986]
MPTTRFRWITIGLVVSLIVINYIDRSAVSFAVRPLQDEFGISTTQYGAISSAFAVGYMVFTFLSGFLVDRFGPRRVLLTAIVLFSLATALIPLAGGFAGLLLIRMVLGVGEAPALPGATRLVSSWLPPREQGLALSLIGGVAVSGSLLIGGPLLTQLIGLTGWRGMFWVMGCVGVVWALLAFWLLRNTPGQSPYAGDRERAHIAGGRGNTSDALPRVANQGGLLANWNLWLVAIGFFSWGFMFWGFMFWLPEYFQRTHGLSIESVGAFSIAPWAAGVLGALLGGVLVDRRYARTGNPRTRLTIIGCAMLAAGAALIPVLTTSSLTVALIFISIGVGCGFITAGIWFVAAIDAAPGRPASAAGFVDAAFALAGIIAPSIMGFVVDRTGTFTSGFVLMSCLAAASALLLLLTGTNPRQAAATAPAPSNAASGD